MDHTCFKHFTYINSFNLLNTAEVGIVISTIHKQEAEAERVTSAVADGIGWRRAQLIQTLLCAAIPQMAV